MTNATLAIQVLPLECDDPINAVNAAIAVIRDSGVVYEVGGMETTLEGDDVDRLLELAAAAHRAALKTSSAVQSNIRLLERPSGLMTIGEKTAPFRADDGA